MKRMISLALVLTLCMSWRPTATQAVGTSASSAILMEAESGRILYENNAHEERLIASITKLMTALVAVEMCENLQELVRVDESCVGIEGSSLYLQPGEEITLEALLYGLLLRSGNDAACAIAVHCSGSVEAFAEKMNEKAAQLGMANSHFANPHGLNAEGHYSSAYDMALLAREVLQNDALVKMTSSKTAVFESRVFTNHNRLLWRYEGCIGLKTGYTEKAGRTLVSAAVRDGMTLIAVTLNDPDDWKDHAALYDYGFAHYSLHCAAEEGDVVARIPVSGALVPFIRVATAQGGCYPVAQGEELKRELRLDTDALDAPVVAGETAGTLCYTLNGEEVISVPLLYLNDVHQDLAPELGFFGKLLALIR